MKSHVLVKINCLTLMLKWKEVPKIFVPVRS